MAVPVDLKEASFGNARRARFLNFAIPGERSPARFNSILLEPRKTKRGETERPVNPVRLPFTLRRRRRRRPAGTRHQPDMISHDAQAHPQNKNTLLMLMHVCESSINIQTILMSAAAVSPSSHSLPPPPSPRCLPRPPPAPPRHLCFFSPPLSLFPL